MESQLIGDPSIAAELSSLGEPNEIISLYGTDRSAAAICHRNQLMDASVFFRKFFSSPLETSKAEFCLQNISTDIVRLVVEFITVKNTNLTVDNILNAIVAAHYLTLPDLEACCSDFIIKNFHGADYLMLHSFAGENNLLLLAGRITQAILENADEFFQSDALVNISSEMLAELISSDALIIQREENVWDAVWKWFLHSEESRYSSLLNLIEFIRFPLMELTSLEKIRPSLSSSRHDILTTRFGSIMEEAEELVRSPYRSFTYSHPKYRLRDKDYQKFELAINGRFSFNPLTKITRQLPPLVMADVDPRQPKQIPMRSDFVRSGSGTAVNTTDGKLILHASLARDGNRIRQWPVYGSYYFLMKEEEWMWHPVHEYEIPVNTYVSDTYHFPALGSRTSENFYYAVRGCPGYTFRLSVESRDISFGPYIEQSFVPMPCGVTRGFPIELAYGDHVFIFHCSHLVTNDPLRHRRTFRWTRGKSEWIELAPAPHSRYLDGSHDNDADETLSHMRPCVTPGGLLIFAEPEAKRSTHNFFDVYDVKNDSWSTIPGPVRNCVSERAGMFGLSDSRKDAEAERETSWDFTLYKAKLILFETEAVDVENKLFQTKVYYHDGREQWSEGEIVQGVQKVNSCSPFSTIGFPDTKM